MISIFKIFREILYPRIWSLGKCSTCTWKEYVIKEKVVDNVQIFYILIGFLSTFINYWDRNLVRSVDLSIYPFNFVIICFVYSEAILFVDYLFITVIFPTLISILWFWNVLCCF
jgi:hypothetical protein